MKFLDNRLLRGGVLLVLAASFMSLSLLVGSNPGYAQRDDGPAQGIQISPVLIDLNAEPGKDYKLKITVTNVTNHDLTVKASVNDFKARDETGNPEILVDGDNNETYSLKSWALIPGSFTLRSKESKVVTVAVDVPTNAEAGGHYGVVRFSAVPTEAEDTNVNISASVGTLVLARIDGQIEEKLNVKEIFVEKNGKKGGVFEATPQKLAERVENTGNVHLKPQGTVTVKNMFGKNVYEAEFNKQGGSILPGSTRRFEQDINKKLTIGKYTIEFNAAYGTHGGVLIGSSTFWVIPFKLIIICLILIVVAILILKKGLKRYNKRVIAKHTQSKHK